MVSYSVELRIHSATGLKKRGQVEIEYCLGEQLLRTGLAQVLGGRCIFGAWTRALTDVTQLELKAREP
jgi:hypothetical protein